MIFETKESEVLFIILSYSSNRVEVENIAYKLKAHLARSAVCM
jgi:hypothetical protein